MPFAERRRHPRFPFHARGFLAIDGKQHLGTVLDLSQKGALFEASEPVNPGRGAECTLRLFHAGQDEICNAAAVVACQREDGLLGLQLLDLDGGARQILQQVVDMNLGVRSLLDRELPEMLGQPAA